MGERLNPEEILRGLHTGWMGHRLETREETESTNDDCIALARAGAPAGTVVVTNWQSKLVAIPSGYLVTDILS